MNRTVNLALGQNYKCMLLFISWEWELFSLFPNWKGKNAFTKLMATCLDALFIFSERDLTQHSCCNQGCYLAELPTGILQDPYSFCRNQTGQLMEIFKSGNNLYDPPYPLLASVDLVSRLDQGSFQNLPLDLHGDSANLTGQSRTR